MDMETHVTENYKYEDRDLDVRTLVGKLWEGSVGTMQAIDLLAKEVHRLHQELVIYRNLATEYSIRLGRVTGND
jgi:hypothetical protein